MCGITGIIDYTNNLPLEKIIRDMSDALAHRGPDDDGVWYAPEARGAFGHRRLAIIDLSPAGAQPMTSANSRYTLTFNGEIFNYLELRAELEAIGCRFRGTSDTEVMLEAFSAWGVEATTRRLNGQFAFGLWDSIEHLLWLGRDHIGIKPMYYSWQDGVFLFGSELKALRAYPRFRDQINMDALALLLRHGYIPAPYSIYTDVFKLPSAALIRIPVDDSAARPTPQTYWNLAAAAQADPIEDPVAAVEQLDALLCEAVSMQMMSDVPLGAFLSGGIDSSTVVALMQEAASAPVMTFSIGFEQTSYNEAQHAKAVAAHLGTNHTELYITPAEARAVIPKLPTLYDEPFADSSQIPTYLVSELARRHVTVSLSGDGGDELFTGYNRYSRLKNTWSMYRYIPRPLRMPIGNALQATPIHKVRIAGQRLACVDVQAMYHHQISHWRNPTKVVKDAYDQPTVYNGAGAAESDLIANDPMRFAPYRDLQGYLPDDILVKVDRASMGVSLEARVPLLDYRVAELALRMPPELKRRDGLSKWPLRQVLYRRVPRKLIDRPKQGFAVPVGQWIRNELRDWAEALLTVDLLQDDFNPTLIRDIWQQHIAGNSDHTYELWTVLMYMAWKTA
jgi:asparagine synthase (glutamine-hydrolysing)